MVPRGDATGKRHGLQGPIDDAFLDSFLCVRPVGKLNSQVRKFAANQLTRFQDEFARWMRGDIRVEQQSELTDADHKANNIVLFGTPGDNPLIARIIRESPISWSRTKIRVGKRSFSAHTHMLSMIRPNPLNPSRYVVINSGHTFHAADFQGNNVLLYPRVGDWAVTDVRTGKVVAEGYFDRNWRL